MKYKKILLFISVLILIGFLTRLTLAWTNPSQNPPNGSGALYFSGGNVGIGVSPTAKLDIDGQIKIRGGSPGAGKILTSDASGLATWKTPASGLPSGTSGQTLRYDGSAWVANSFLTNTGTRIGINTASPGGRLVVVGEGTTSATYALNVTNSGGTSILFVRDDGNVGIGTTGPRYKLDVAGNLRVAGPLVNTAGTSNYTYQDVLHYRNNSSNQTGAMVITVPDGGNTMLNIRITGYDYVSNQGAWEAIIGGYWYTSGDNWINTSAEIRGSAPFRRIRLMKDTASGAPRIVLGETTTVWQYPQFKIDVEVAGYSGQANYTSGWSATLSTDLSALTPLAEPMIKIYVDSSGNVGIGTTGPAEKLHISGNLKINEFSIKRISATEMGVYDSTNTLVLIFDEGS